MTIPIEQTQKMRWIVFWVFITAYALILVLTISSIFLGFGQPTEDERNLLFKTFIVEVGVAVLALFYALFGIKQHSGTESQGAAEINKQKISKQKDEQIQLHDVFENQEDTNKFLLDYIEEHKNSIKKATVVQYSSDQVSSVIQKLLKNDIPFDLFLQHPARAISDMQRTKIISNIKTYCDICRNKKNKINATYFHLYRGIGTIRAIQLDNAIAIGYYTYESPIEKEKEKEKEKESFVLGHDNPMFFYPATSNLGKKVNLSFENSVETLRENSDSYSLRELLDFMEEKRLFPWA